MEIKTVNVVEVLDGCVLQIISFVGENAEEEAKQLFKTLILEHNDPDNDPPQNVLGFDEETIDNWCKYGKYDDECGYSLHLIHSRYWE